MIRVLIENILLFLAPTLIYLGYALLVRSRSEAPDQSGQQTTTAEVLNDAPLLWLFVAGAVLVIVTLFAFASESGGRPGQQYTPPTMKDGKVVPGHFD